MASHLPKSKNTKNFHDLHVDVNVPRQLRPNRRSPHPLTPGPLSANGSRSHRSSYYHSPYPKSPRVSFRHPKSPGAPFRYPQSPVASARHPESPFQPPAGFFGPGPRQCHFRCGNPRTRGSLYCRNDTCRDDTCTNHSQVWGGYCAEHGCAAGGCRRGRAITRTPCPLNGPRGPERYSISRHCKGHACRAGGCDMIGVKKMAGYCAKHFGDCYDYC